MKEKGNEDKVKMPLRKKRPPQKQKENLKSSRI